MRTSFHHQPEAQHPNFQLSTSWQADYPIYWGQSGQDMLNASSSHFDPERTWAGSKSRSAVVPGCPFGPRARGGCRATGRFRTIQICPKDLPVPSRAG